MFAAVLRWFQKARGGRCQPVSESFGAEGKVCLRPSSGKHFAKGVARKARFDRCPYISRGLERTGAFGPLPVTRNCSSISSEDSAIL